MSSIRAKLHSKLPAVVGDARPPTAAVRTALSTILSQEVDGKQSSAG